MERDDFGAAVRLIAGRGPDRMNRTKPLQQFRPAVPASL